MTVGYLGDIVFSVSSNQVKTPNNIKYSNSANYSEQKRHNASPILEYTGYNLASISFKMTLSYLLGVKVEDELKKIDDYMKIGKLLKFVLGKRCYGSYRWVITKYSVDYQTFNVKGEVVTADITISLKEYNNYSWGNTTGGATK
ncbi:MAG: phage tail protein [Ruminococcaceae bacterium]|nr:phage tail protein [Oscillospiraceae bacterium]